MRTRPISLMLLTFSWVAPAAALADKPDNDDKSWLEEVKPIISGDEKNIFDKLKNKEDRLEFRKIFWARRDPDLNTVQNEFQDEYVQARATADKDYALGGQRGSTTDCGRVFILLGKPDEVRKSTNDPLVAQTWVYRDRPGQTFQGGKVELGFDANCGSGRALGSQLDRLAASKVFNPNIDYRLGKNDKLTKLVDLMPKDTPARALVKQPRQDFPLGAQISFMKTSDGGTAVIGLVRGDASGLSIQDEGGRKAVGVSVAASALSENGREAWTERIVKAPVGPDGRFLASFKMGLRPGKYTVNAGAVETQSGKGSLASVPIVVPDFQQQETAADGTVKPLVSGTVLVVAGFDERPASEPENVDPFGAYRLGSGRILPIFQGDLKRTDTISFIYQVYDLQTDSATGKPNGTSRLRIVRTGKGIVTSSPATEINMSPFGTEVGPVPLSGFEPGQYTARLEVTDKVSGKTATWDTPFEVKP